MLVLRGQQSTFHDFLTLTVVLEELLAVVAGTFFFSERVIAELLIWPMLKLLLQVFKFLVDGRIPLRVLLLLLDAALLHFVDLCLDAFDLLLDGNLRISQADFSVVLVAAATE